ncbi:MAG TPA: hypothetical protein VF620_01650 [Allosphingosinicella sp.]|jgi:hypothetical protein
MRKITASLSAALVLATASAQAAPRLSGEAKLAREIEGRVAGEPVRCLPFHRISSSRIIDDTAIVYDAGSTIYVNRPRAGRESLDRWDTLVTRTFGSQLCSTDVVQLYDAGSRMQTGFVFLGEFVPYRKPKARAGH